MPKMDFQVPDIDNALELYHQYISLVKQTMMTVISDDDTSCPGGDYLNCDYSREMYHLQCETKRKLKEEQV